MNSNKLFTVSKSSKLYKFYQFIYEHNPLCAILSIFFFTLFEIILISNLGDN